MAGNITNNSKNNNNKNTKLLDVNELINKEKKYEPGKGGTAGKDTNPNHYLAGLPTIDIRKGGQWGFIPRIGGVEDGKPMHEWMHEQAYLQRNLIPVLLQPPRYHELLPNQKELDEAVKALFEVHAKVIEGFDASLTVESIEHELGFSGGSMKEPSKTTRGSTSVTLNGIHERYGNPFEFLLDLWIRYGMIDPDVGYPLITRVKGVSEDKVPAAWTAEWYTATAIFIEPDPLMRRCVRAWLVSNMYPEANPDITGKKDKNAGYQMKEMSIPMGGFALPPTNKRIKALADTILKNLQLWKKDPEDVMLPANEESTKYSKSENQSIFFDGVRSNKGDINGADGLKPGETPTKNAPKPQE